MSFIFIIKNLCKRDANICDTESGFIIENLDTNDTNVYVS